MNLPLSKSAGATRRRVALGEILTLVNGRAYKQDELLSSGTPVIRIQNLNGGDRWYYSDLVLPEDKYCSDGDLLFAWSATFGPYFWRGPKSIYHYHIWKVIPSEQLDKKFAFYLLDSITSRVKSAGRGISMIHMTKSGMEAWEVDLPPLDEQRRIADILDKADQLRQKRKQAIALLDSLTSGLINKLVAEGNSSDNVPLGDYLNFVTSGGRNWSSYYSAVGRRFIRSFDVQFDGLSDSDAVYVTPPDNAEARRATCKAGDVLLTITGSRIGRVAALPNDLAGSYVSQHVAILRPNNSRLNSRFLSSFLSSTAGQRQIEKWQYGQTKPGLN